MKYRNNILHEFFLWSQFFIVHHYYVCIKLHTESFKPVITKPDKPIFVGYDDCFNLLFHYFIQQLVPLLTVIIKTVSIVFYTLVNNNSFCITKLPQKCNLIFQVIFLIFRWYPRINNNLPLIIFCIYTLKLKILIISIITSVCWSALRFQYSFPVPAL